MPMPTGVSGLDKGLAIGAGVMAVLAAAAAAYLAWGGVYTPPPS